MKLHIIILLNLLWPARWVISANFNESDALDCKIFADHLKPAHVGRYSYEKVHLEYGNYKDYELHKRIGGGAYGDIYIGRNDRTNQDVVVKKYHKLNLEKMNREIVITQAVCGGPHIGRMIDVLDFPDTKYPAVVLELIRSTSYQSLFPNLTPIDVKRYMYQFLMALHHAHNQYIIHYDIKPDNILIDVDRQDLKLIDWGLSRYTLPGEPIKTAGTLQYKSPEMLMEYMKSGTATDMWSYGCIFAEWIFRRLAPLFPGGFHSNQLNEIAKVLGTEELKSYMEKYRIKRNLHDILINIHHKKSHQPVVDWQFLNFVYPTPSYPRVGFEVFVNSTNKNYATRDALDLLGKLLRYDHNERLTAYQAMQHPYFDDVREKENNVRD